MAEKPPLLEQVRQCLRLKHYSIRTEDAYVQFIKRFILFQRKRHPSEMGAVEIRQFFSHLATEGRVSASTQNQALAALLFLYREVLGVELPFIEGIERLRDEGAAFVSHLRQRVAVFRREVNEEGKFRADCVDGREDGLLVGLR